MLLRAMGENEKDILRDFLYEAIFIPEGVKPPERSIIEQPELRIYYENFGEGRADHCIVADDNGKVIGAVWTRIMNDYGHVDDETPSFAISLYKEYRGQGIGTRMMNEMLLHCSKRRAIGKRLLLCRKPIMLSGCMKRLDSRLWMRMKKSLLWCVICLHKSFSG